MWRGRFWQLLLSVSWLGGCSGASENDAEVNSLDGPLALVTFNAALGVGLADHTESRLAALLRTLPELSADVVCLQEIWRLEDVRALVEAASPRFAHAFSSITEGDSLEQGCTLGESAALQTCLDAACAELLDDQLLECAIDNCATAFAAVSPNCQGCVIANQALPLDELMDVCSADESVSATLHQNGLLLLSRLPLLDGDFAVFDSSLGERGVLMARIETAFSPSTELLCTHLGATQTNIDYPGAFGSWDNERLVQTQQLLEAVGSRRSDGSFVALLGDMNSGPSTPNADGESPEAYELIRESGLHAPYVDSGDARCTWCPENSLTEAPGDGGSGSVIDHVFISPLPNRARALPDRVLDQPILVDVSGDAVETHLSDHFGVRVTLTLDP